MAKGEYPYGYGWKSFQRQLESSRKFLAKLEAKLRAEGYEPVPGFWDEWIKTEKGK